MVFNRISDPELKEIARDGAAAYAGYAAGTFTTMTGMSTTIHEYGHVAAIHMTHNVPPGNGPSVQVNGWDHLKEAHNATAVKDTVAAIGKWFFQGSGGMTRWNTNYPENFLGKALGFNGKYAFISIAGSMPGLIINSTLAGIGVKLIHEKKAAGYALTAYALTEHAFSSVYPWTAAMMSKDEMVRAMTEGHDFANFAYKVGDMTGVAAETVALTTAIAWTAFVPAVALGVHLYQSKKRYKHMVFDEVALQKWLEAPDRKGNHFKKEQLRSYPRRKDLEDAAAADSSPANQRRLRLEEFRFQEHMLKNAPRGILNEQKKVIFENFSKSIKKDRVTLLLSAATTTGSLLRLTFRITNAFSASLPPTITAIGTVAGYVAIPLLALNIATGAYEVYTQFKQSDQDVPKIAKMISVAKLVVTVVSTTTLIVGIFVPGINVAVIVVFSICGVGSLALGVIQKRIIASHNAAKQAVEKDTWEKMHELADAANDDGCIDELPQIRAWLACVESAKKRGLLSDEQITWYNAFPGRNSDSQSLT